MKDTDSLLEQAQFIRENISVPMFVLNKRVNIKFAINRNIDEFIRFCLDNDIKDTTPRGNTKPGSPVSESYENALTIDELTKKLKSAEFKLKMRPLLTKHFKSEDRKSRVPISYMNTESPRSDADL